MPDLDPTPHDAAGAGSTTVAADSPATATPADPLASLKHMSTTAGLGSGDYVAINPVSIAAIVLGFGSAVAFFGEILLIVPAVGIICALVAVRQIRGSNGTQAGMLLAIGGLALASLIGGGAVVRLAAHRIDQHRAEAEIAGVIERLGQDLSNNHYEDAYSLFSPTIRNRVGKQEFTDTIKKMIARHGVGGLTQMTWNGQAIAVEDTAPENPAYWTMILVNFEKPEDLQTRHTVQFMRRDGKWQVEYYPSIFPTEHGDPTGGAGQ